MSRILKLLPCVLLVIALPAHAQWFSDSALELSANDNLSRSEKNKDQAGDVSLKGTANGGYYWQTGNFTGVSLIGSLSKTAYETYSGLNNLDVGVSVDLSHKFGIGETVPVLGMSIGAGRNTYNTDIRDADIFTAGINLSKRLNPLVMLSAGLGYEDRNGDHNTPVISAPASPSPMPHAKKPGDVWDVTSWSAFLRAERDISEYSWITVGYQYQDGEIVSTGTPYTLIINAASATTNDPVFGSAAVAYRIDAKTHLFALDYNRAVLETATIYAGIEYQDTKGESSLDYSVSIARAGFIYSF